MLNNASKTHYFHIRSWSIILTLIALIPNMTLAQILPNPKKDLPIIILTAPDDIKDFLIKHFKIPTEPFTDSSAEKTFLYRAQKEISNLLATEGYFAPSITVSHQTQGTIMKPEIKVDPGVLTRIGKISINFEGEIAQQDTKYQKRIELIRASWSLQKDTPFRSAEWEKAKATLLSELTREEFAASTIVASQAIIDPNNARADLSITIDSGPAFYLGAIQITGLERYDQKLITNLAPFKAGDVYRRDLMDLFQIALQKASQFSTVSVNISPHVGEHKSVPVQVVVTEAQSQRFAFGTGYSSNNGARGEINYRNHNFLNRAWNLTSMLRLEQKRQTFFTGIDTFPNQDNINYSMGASYQMTDIENLRTAEQRIGVTRNYQTQHILMQLGLHGLREEKKPSGALHQTNEALVFDWRWRYQVVDDPIHVRRGNVTEIRIGGSTNQLLSDQDFIRSYVRHQSWWPIGPQDTIFLRAEVGYTLASSRFGIPQEYLFRAGGIQSVRGYDFKSIGVEEGNAIVGGRVMTTSTIEYTHWLTHQWGAAVFADIGSAADSWQAMHPFLGYGSGIRWRSPAGPIGLDLARAHETGTLQVHFSLAIAF